MKKRTLFASSMLALIIALSGCGDKGEGALPADQKTTGEVTTVSAEIK